MMPPLLDDFDDFPETDLNSGIEKALLSSLHYLSSTVTTFWFSLICFKKPPRFALLKSNKKTAVHLTLCHQPPSQVSAHLAKIFFFPIDSSPYESWWPQELIYIWCLIRFRHARVSAWHAGRGRVEAVNWYRPRRCCWDDRGAALWGKWFIGGCHAGLTAEDKTPPVLALTPWWLLEATASRQTRETAAKVAHLSAGQAGRKVVVRATEVILSG